MDSTVIDLSLDLYNFYGSRIGIQSNSVEILAHFRSVYGRFYDQAPAGAADGIVEAIDNIAEGQELRLTDGNESYSFRCRTLYEFDHNYYGKGSIPDPIAFITYLFLKNQYRSVHGYKLFHAAALTRDGKALIMPALERMGKTTLAVQLVKSGFKFLSDEVACIDVKSGMVEPYPRRLNINAPSCDLLNLPEWPDEFLRKSGADEVEWAIDIEQIVPRSISAASPLSHVIFLHGFGERPRLTPVSSSNALFRLFKFSFSPPENPAAQLYRFAPIVDGVKCHNLICADLNETARLVADLVGGRCTE